MGVRAQVTEESEPVVLVWDMNWDAVRVFLAMTTQWRVAVMSTLEQARMVRLGLDYAALETVVRALGARRRKGRLFRQVQVLEQAALAALQEVAE